MFKLVKQYWGLLLIAVIVIYFISLPKKKQIIVVNSNSHIIEKVVESDPRVKAIWNNGSGFIQNNSNKTIYLESVEYSSSSSSYTPKIISIKKGVKSINNKVHYIFVTPPSSIRVKSGAPTSRWHLYR